MLLQIFDRLTGLKRENKMKKVRIITDRAADLNEDIIKKYDIEIAEMDISFGEKVYYEGKGIGLEEFYKKMKEEKRLPKTSCPSPERFIELYKKDDSDAIVLSISAKLSGTYNSAVLAKEIYNDENGKNNIKIINTMSGSIGQGILAVYAAQLSEKGKNIEEIYESLEKVINKSNFYGVLQTLENAIKGGRISKISGGIINTLKLKPIIKIENGEVIPFDKARGEKASIEKMVNLFLDSEENITKKTLFIAHSNCIEKAILLKEIILKRCEYREIVICNIGSVMGTYASEGCLLLNSLELPEKIYNEK